MDTPHDVDRLMKQTQRYWYEDGIADMAMGGFMLLLGLLFAGESLTPQGSPLWGLWGVGLPMFLIGGGLVAGWIVKRLKSRVTYPRTGYVEYERKGLSRFARMLAMALAAAVLAASFVVVIRWSVSPSLFFGLAFLGTYSYVAFRVRLWRYLLFGLWSFVLSLVIAPLSLNLDQSSALYYPGLGLGLIVSGWVTWRRYDRSAPRAQEINDGTAA
jgi:hypothetical protein